MSHDDPGGTGVVGLVLAAGSGSRFGRPKALVEDGDGSWLRRAATMLLEGGCEEVVVVLGAAAEQARDRLVDLPATSVTVAEAWSEGLSASLRAGLAAVEASDGQVAVVTLVDLPDLHAGTVRRVLDRLGTGPDVLGRACFRGRPGHPVVLGRRHWARVGAETSGDAGARDYLRRHGAVLVECGDLATGADVDA